MRRLRAIHQMMPGFLYGDALGNQAMRLRACLHQWGYESQVYAQFRDQRLSEPGVDYTRYHSRSDQAVIFHYSIGSPLTAFVRQLPETTVLYYHNVTPPEYFADYQPELARLLEQGRRELALFKDAPLALAASEYNRAELLALGFKQVEVLPYFVSFDELKTSATSAAGADVVRRYADGWMNLLFVGRLAPNKRQDNVIRAFNYYHKLVNPHSRLILVGSEANAPGYRLELEALAQVLDLEHVILTGPVGLREGLGGYFQVADVFLCLSEHEGFCVPLLEAMAFDVPVLALNATGVTYALGSAGVMVNRKHYPVMAELIDLLSSNTALRQAVIARQQQRLADFAPAVLEARLRQIVQSIASL